MFNYFKDELRKAFEFPLPGKKGQAPLRPYVKIYKDLDAPVLPNRKEGAVMSLIYPVNNIPHILFIERPVYDGVHSGQIAFPGGKIENSDSTFLDAALRETYEEIGIAPQSVEVLGSLSEVYVLASNFMVYPFVGILNEIPEIIPDHKEVAGTLEVPLFTFFEPNILKEKPMKNGIGLNLMAPYYDLQGKILWGATAMMVSELCTIIQTRNISIR